MHNLLQYVEQSYADYLDPWSLSEDENSQELDVCSRIVDILPIVDIIVHEGQSRRRMRIWSRG